MHELADPDSITPYSLDDLFERTLSGGYDDELPWNTVHELRAIGTREVFDKAAAWCALPDALRRARGADVLAQIGRTIATCRNSFLEESFRVVTELLRLESHELPLSSAIYALGHIANPAAVPLITKWSAHPDENVRYAVAFALGCFPDDPISIRELIGLMQDSDEDVRDWATFGLGVQGETDTPEIRDALWKNVDDPLEDTRMEALKGLGKRKDQRIAPKLLAVLTQDTVLEGYIKAAESLLDKEGDDCEGWTVSDYVKAIEDWNTKSQT